MNRERLKSHAEVIREAAAKCGYMTSGFIVVRIIPRADEPQDPQTFESLMALAGYNLEPFNDEYFISVYRYDLNIPA